MKATLMTAMVFVMIAGQGRPSSSFDIPYSRIEVHVVSDQGQPVGQAFVGMGVTGSRGEGIARGETDTNGAFATRLKVTGSLYLRLEKSGYYRSSGELWSGPSSGGMVPPTNRYTVVLKKIVDPVPMVVRDVGTILPALGRPCGFDLLASDWVRPHGTGVVADCEIVGWKDVKGQRDWDWGCEVFFTNANGVVRHRAPGRAARSVKSDLIPPQTIPEGGYGHSVKFEESFHAGKSSSESADVNDHLLFRVRAETNAAGMVVSAYGGWVEGAVRMEGRNTETMWLGFKCHINPDPKSKSLEPR